MVSAAERIFNRRLAIPWQIIAWPISFMATKFEIEELRGIEPKSKLLDVGVGTGIAAARIVSELDIHVDGVDASRAMLSIAKRVLPERVRLFHGNATHLPFEARSYDVAIYNYVFRYLKPEQAELALAEAARVVRPGGKVIVADLNLPRLRPWRQSVGESVDSTVLGLWSRFSKEEFIDYMRGLGLEYEKTRYPLFSFMMVFRRI